jgi:hypothetical protein
MSPSQQPPKIACPHCQALIKAPTIAPGSLVNCPKCGQGFRLGEKPRDKEKVQGPKSKVQGPAPASPQSPTAPRPLAAPVKPPAAEVVVPRDFAGAAATTQPAHRPASDSAAQPMEGGSAPAGANWQADTTSMFPTVGPPRRGVVPDYLVDPNLLPPPPPKEKAKATTVPVVCYLCGTRTDVALDQIGKTVKCPDCYAVNEVVAPKEKGEKTPKGPTLEGAKEYDLSEQVQRPAYRPLQAPRGEYEILASLDPKSAPPGWSPPDARTAMATEPAAEDEEIRVAAPVERVELKREPIHVLPLDPEESLYDGRYDDGLVGDGVDRKQPEAWKKAPFLIGLVEFLFFPSTLPRWVMYSIGLAIPLNVGNLLYVAATGDDPSGKVLAIFLGIAFSLSFGGWAMPFCASALAVVQDTANGLKEVESWPDWNFFDWFYNGLFIPWAAFLSGLPGMFLTSALFGSGFDPRIMSFVLGAPLPLSWLVLFPPVLFSMLFEASLMAPASGHVIRSFREASEGWLLFYMYSFGLLILAIAAGSLALSRNFMLCTLGAAGLVTVALLYARLVGRLMWYAGQKTEVYEEQPEAN